MLRYHYHIENSHSTLSRHLAGHCRNMTSTAEVRTWCRSNIKVEILWKGTTTSLQKTAGTWHCRLCAMERVIINRNMNSKSAQRNSNDGSLMNNRDELKSNCTCKTRFLRFNKPGEGGLWWGSFGSETGLTVLISWLFVHVDCTVGSNCMWKGLKDYFILMTLRLPKARNSAANPW